MSMNWIYLAYDWATGRLVWTRYWGYGFSEKGKFLTTWATMSFSKLCSMQLVGWFVCWSVINKVWEGKYVFRLSGLHIQIGCAEVIIDHKNYCKCITNYIASFLELVDRYCVYSFITIVEGRHLTMTTGLHKHFCDSSETFTCREKTNPLRLRQWILKAKLACAYISKLDRVSH
jgi:hypothetical protein